MKSTPGCNLGPKFSDPCWSILRKRLDDLVVSSVKNKDFHDLVHMEIWQKKLAP